jgi:invasion protein IalB
MQIFFSRTAMISALLAASVAVGAAPESGKKFKDWTVECETFQVPQKKLDVKVEGSETPAKEAEEAKSDEPSGESVEGQTICQIVQTLTEKSSDRPVLQVAVGYLPDTEKPVAAFLLPLGVWLPPGLQLQVDEGKAGRVPFDICDPQGCHAGVELDDEFLAMMKKGNELNVTFGGRNRKGITAPVSLQGFTAALDALKQ